MKVAVALFLLLMPAQAWTSDSIVVLGTLVSNGPMDYVPDECPADAICLRSWWRSTIKVQKTIAGAALSGKVVGATMQHTSLNQRFKKSVRLFVLKPINDPKQRTKLRADYYLVSMAEPYQMFCLSEKPMDLGIDVDETYVAGADDDETYCFELPKG